jgi:hypothetical protein
MDFKLDIQPKAELHKGNGPAKPIFTVYVFL